MQTRLTVHSVDDAEEQMHQIRASAARARAWLAAQTGDPLDMLRRIKFETRGFHPVQNRALNFIEQVNQTWTFVVALTAAKQLLLRHPDAKGFHLAPGAHASQDLDIMSVEPGLVGAETFAAVTPRNNGKLLADRAKLAGRAELHRYIFFMSPEFPRNERLPKFERGGVEVWSVEV